MAQSGKIYLIMRYLKYWPILLLLMLGAWIFRTEFARPSVRYTGVNLSGAEFGLPGEKDNLPGTFGLTYTYPTAGEIDYFLAKGMNTFRLPFRWERLQTSPDSALVEAELRRLDFLVGYATTRGAYVILDLHNFSRYFPQINTLSNVESGKTGLMDGTTANTHGMVVTHAMYADFWSRLASHYKDNPRVIFGLMNEPNAIPETVLVTSQNAAIAAIRATGATNLILVSGNRFTGAGTWDKSDATGAANAAAMLGIFDSGNNFAFEMHEYLDRDGSGTSAAINHNDPMTGIARLSFATQWLRTNHQRGFLGEFAVDNTMIGGAPAQIGDEALNNLLTYLGQNRDVWLGWTFWGGGPWWPTQPPSLFHIDPIDGGDQAVMRVLQPYFATIPKPKTTAFIATVVGFTLFLVWRSFRKK